MASIIIWAWIVVIGVASIIEIVLAIRAYRDGSYRFVAVFLGLAFGLNGFAIGLDLHLLGIF